MRSSRTGFSVLNVFLLFCVIVSDNAKGTSVKVQEQNVPMLVDVINMKPTESEKHNKWNGKYFPEHLNSENYGVISEIVEDNEDFSMYNVPKSKKSMMTMGSMDINSTCDDGKTNLTRDWDRSPYNYTCMLNHSLPVSSDIKPLLERDLVPKYYVANHVCMKETIAYNHDIPSFGPHRPAWARYGQYKFLPKQRWLHNLEHGSVVMLYHPCTHPVLVQRMRTVLKGCLFRHIITPYNLVPTDRPIVLVTWGNRLYMNDVDTKLATDYIKKYANHAKETTARDGQYDHLLIEAAEVISPDDVSICPTPHKRKNRI